MKKIRVLFYKPDFDGHLLDNLITGYSQLANSLLSWKHRDVLSKLKCGHVEIWTPNQEGLFEENTDHPNSFLGACWTSTMRGEINGACCRAASEVLDHPHRWYYYEDEVSDNGYTAMIEWMKSEIACNKRYDIKDILKFFLPVRTQDPSDCQKICSGFSHIAIWHAGNHTRNESVYGRYEYNYSRIDLFSPLRLSLNLWSLGGIPIDLETGKVVV